MDFHCQLLEDPSIISLSSIAPDDEINHMTLSSSHHQTCDDDIVQQMNDHIRRLQKRIRYLEKKLVEMQKENRKLKSQQLQHQCQCDDDEVERSDEENSSLIGSQSASLRVLRDLINMFDSSNKEINPSQSGQSDRLMDLVRSLHYLSVGLGKGTTEDDSTKHSSN